MIFFLSFYMIFLQSIDLQSSPSSSHLPAISIIELLLYHLWIVPLALYFFPLYISSSFQKLFGLFSMFRIHLLPLVLLLFYKFLHFRIFKNILWSYTFTTLNCNITPKLKHKKQITEQLILKYRTERVSAKLVILSLYIWYIILLHQACSPKCCWVYKNYGCLAVTLILPQNVDFRSVW